MATSKIAITIDDKLLKHLDFLVKSRGFSPIEAGPFKKPLKKSSHEWIRVALPKNAQSLIQGMNKP